MADHELPQPERGRVARRVLRSYPPFGGASERCLITDMDQPPPYLTPEMLPWQELEDTVLGAALPWRHLEPCQMYLGTPLPSPHHGIMLPRIPADLVPRTPAYDSQGRFLGQLCRIPGLLVHANQIARFQEINAERAANGERPVDYDWAEAIGKMALEAAFMIGKRLSRRVLKWKLRPGFHAHAIPRAGLPVDQIVISEGFARRLFADHQKALEGVITSAQGLSGFPIWCARFPVFEHGCLPMRLVIEKSAPKTGEAARFHKGFFLGINPWVMDLLMQGDFDGDVLHAALRLEEVKRGQLEITNIPTRAWQNEFRGGRAHTSLSSLRIPAGAAGPELRFYEEKDGTNKLRDKAAFPDLFTPEARRQAVERADERRFVAVFTMVFCWYIPRVLMQTGRYSVQEAAIKGHRAGEFWNEACFDARKGKSQFASLDIHWLIDLLNRGGEPLPVSGLVAKGIPAEHLEALAEAWQLSGYNLRGACGISPVYNDLILKRSRMTGGDLADGDFEHPVTEMLRVFKQLEIPEAEVCQAIMDDLDGIELLAPPVPPTLR